MKARRCRILVNNRAGGGRRVGEVGRCARELISRGWHVEIVAPSDQDSLREAARQAAIDSLDGLVVAGGDGTWHDAVQELATTGSPIALLPIGTGDDNARSLGFPARDPETLARLIDEGSTRVIDLGRITCQGSSRWFSGVASIGFDSQVNSRANDYQRLPGTLRYLVAAARELTTFDPGSYLITRNGGFADEQTVEVQAMLIAVGNGGFYGGGMMICPGYQLDDGLLDATIITRLPRWRFVKTLPTVYRGTHVRDDAVITMRASRLHVVGGRQLVYADGEYVGILPATLESVPGALTIVSA